MSPSPPTKPGATRAPSAAKPTSPRVSASSVEKRSTRSRTAGNSHGESISSSFCVASSIDATASSSGCLRGAQALDADLTTPVPQLLEVGGRRRLTCALGHVGGAVGGLGQGPRLLREHRHDARRRDPPCTEHRCRRFERVGGIAEQLGGIGHVAVARFVEAVVHLIDAGTDAGDRSQHGEREERDREHDVGRGDHPDAVHEPALPSGQHQIPRDQRRSHGDHHDQRRRAVEPEVGETQQRLHRKRGGHRAEEPSAGHEPADDRHTEGHDGDAEQATVGGRHGGDAGHDDPGPPTGPRRSQGDDHGECGAKDQVGEANAGRLTGSEDRTQRRQPGRDLDQAPVDVGGPDASARGRPILGTANGDRSGERSEGSTPCVSR